VGGTGPLTHQSAVVKEAVEAVLTFMHTYPPGAEKDRLIQSMNTLLLKKPIEVTEKDVTVKVLRVVQDYLAGKLSRPNAEQSIRKLTGGTLDQAIEGLILMSQIAVKSQRPGKPGS